MITISRIFKNETDVNVLRRIVKSMRIISRHIEDNQFETINLENHHHHYAEILGGKIICSCEDSRRGNECKHEIALLRGLNGGIKL